MSIHARNLVKESLAVLSVLCLFAGPPAGAQTAVRQYNVSAGPLSTALTEFAAQAGIMLSADAELTRGKTSGGLRGNYDTRAGLALLLAGTGLNFAFSDADTVLLSAPSRPLPLQPIRVAGEKIGRTIAETASSVAVIDGEGAGRPRHRNVKSAIRPVPNVLAEAGINSPAIRGIDGGAGYGQAYTIGGQPRIPILIDGVARPFSYSYNITGGSNWDLASVEVARGPQSASTGRNAMGGAIRVYTQAPDLAGFAAAARLKGATQNGTLAGAGMVNLPFAAGQAAFRGAFELSEGKSYVRITDLRTYPADLEEESLRAYRGRLRLMPAAIPGLELNFGVNHSRTAGHPPGAVDGDLKQLTLANFALNNSYEIRQQTTYQTNTRYALNAHAELELRASRVNSEQRYVDTVGLGSFMLAQSELEGEALLRLEALGMLQRGVLGVIHNRAREDGVSNPERRLVAFFGRSFGRVGYKTDGEIDNTGLYAEAELALDRLGLPDHLTFIFGGRYEIDERKRRVKGMLRPVPVSINFSAKRFLPKLGLRYSPSHQLTLGYAYSEGFRPGGADVDLIGGGAVSVLRPENLRQHELYAKTSFWDDRVYLGLSAFHYEHEDAQVAGAGAVRSALGFPMFGNVPGARGMGLELDTQIRLGRRFELSGGLGLLHTEITDAGAVLARFQGQELPRAPGVTGSLGLTYRAGNGFEAGLNTRLVGSTVSGLGQQKIDAYALLDLTAAWRMLVGLGELRLDAFIENVTDQHYFIYRAATLNSVGRPLTFGLAATFEY